jgi:hypothetical protein
VVIGRRFRGPPASANGGYACGILAAALEAPAAEVNLRNPPPLEQPLRIEAADGAASLLDGEQLVADATGLERIELELPQPPPQRVAEDADAQSEFYDDHAFPGCFVCGPDRHEGDGLRIFPGDIEGRTLMACAWKPGDEFAGADGVVDELIVWSVLDCPSGNAAHRFARDETVMVLARLRGEIAKPIRAGEPHVVVGWPGAVDGRKHDAATAIFSAAGEPLAWAEALWIELK